MTGWVSWVAVPGRAGAPADDAGPGVAGDPVSAVAVGLGASVGRIPAVEPVDRARSSCFRQPGRGDVAGDQAGCARSSEGDSRPAKPGFRSRRGGGAGYAR